MSPALQQSVKPHSITASQEKTPFAATLLKVTKTRTGVVKPPSRCYAILNQDLRLTL